MEIMSNELFLQLTGVLTAWLILSIIIEESMGVLFNWKHFKEKMSGKGWKTPMT